MTPLAGSPRLPRALWLLVGLGFLLRLLMVLPWDLHTLVDGKAILVDDSFYSLGVARNVVRGLGFSADGLHVTNGFQPLYVFLAIPLYALGALFGDDQVLPVYLAQVMLSAFHALAALWLYRIAAGLTTRRPLVWLPVVAWLVWPYGVRVGVNGLETSLAVFFSGWVVAFYGDRLRDDPAPSRRSLATLGVLLGLAFWSRMDTVILAGAVGLDLLTRRREQPFALRLRRVLVPALVSAAVFLPWFVFSFALTGDLLPISGKAVRLLSTVTYPQPWYLALSDNLTTALGILMDSPFLVDWKAVDLPALGIYPRHWLAHRWMTTDMLLRNGLPLLALAGALWLRRREAVRRLLDRYGFYLLYAAGMVLVYGTVIFGLHFYYRYLFPVIVLGIPLVTFVLDALADSRVGRALAVLAGLVLAVNVGFQARGLVNDHGAQQFFKLVETYQFAEPVAAFQSGVFSYFYPGKPAANLDGVVNREAYEAIGQAAICRYIREQGIRSVVDFSGIIRGFTWHDRPPCKNWRVEYEADGVEVVRFD